MLQSHLGPRVGRESSLHLRVGKGTSLLKSLSVDKFILDLRVLYPCFTSSKFILVYSITLHFLVFDLLLD